MKTLKISSLLMGMTLMGFVSCSDDDNPDEGNNCEAAIVASTEAAAEFSAATDENYTSLCSDYKAALEAQIDACGDPDGELQAIIDGLGDCTQDPGQNVQGELSVTTGTFPVNFEVITVVVENGLIKVNGEDTSSFSHKIYFEVAQGETGVDVMQNFQIELNGTVFYPYDEGSQFDFTSEIETNTDGTLIGSFYNVVTNEEGADMNLANGTIDLEY
jgi:hypothetical protein